MSTTNGTSNTDDIQRNDRPDSACAAYMKHGWRLTPIKPQTKKPLLSKWNTLEHTFHDPSKFPTECGIGLCHAFSNTMCLDIDDWTLSEQFLSEHGINLKELFTAPDAVIISSGRKRHAKLLYTLPTEPLPSVKIYGKQNGKAKNFLEFRCGTKNGQTVQDILPPTIHPLTKQPYQWMGADWKKAPELPPELLALWKLKLEPPKTASPESQELPDWKTVESALKAIPCDLGRQDWVKIGMALHWLGNETGELDRSFHLWHTWSKGPQETPSAKYQGEQDLSTVWRSFHLTGITIRSLFRLAMQHGWKPQQNQVDELFIQYTDNKTADPNTVQLQMAPPLPSPVLEKWPEILARRAKEISISVGCDPIVPLFAGLASAAGVCDARSRLEIAPGFTVPPVVWMMIIGDPADKKTPGSKPMKRPLLDIESANRPEYTKELLKWEMDEAIHERQRKEFIASCMEGEKQDWPNVPNTVLHLDEKPVPPKILVQDITSAQLVRDLQHRPEGCVCWLDESHGWFRKLAETRGTEDRSVWVSSFEGDSYTMDRVGAGSVFCENFAVSIYTNVQPRVLNEHLSTLTADGLLQRFMMARLRPNLTNEGNPIPKTLSCEPYWTTQIERLHKLPPRQYALSPSAYLIFRQFQTWHLEYMKDNRALALAPDYQTASGKLVGHAARLIFLFHLLSDPEQHIVSKETTENAIHVIRNFIMPSLYHVYHDADQQESFEQWLINHVLTTADSPTVSLRELKRSAKRQLSNLSSIQKSLAIQEGMELLEQMNWVMLAKRTRTSAEWWINPSLKNQFRVRRRELLIIRQKRLDLNRSIAMSGGKYVVRQFTPGFREEFGEILASEANA
ncbi:MAG: DUF3987 domain-containing protein [Shewanella sp.]|nr:DUF3987 domain-containing protein [Shewanella sp.]